MTLISTQPIRVYADTSVCGGVFDDEFATPSRAFFEQIDFGAIAIHSPPEVIEHEDQDI